MLVGRLLFAAVLPIAAGHVLFGNVRIAVHQYKAAKETLAARHRGG
jgi:hypothetical protein